jgi:hypothetical protein
VQQELSKVSENPSKRVENLSKDAMTAEAISTEMTQIVREAAGPRAQDDTIERQIDRASRYLGLPFRRARAYWYGEVRNIPAHEAEQLRFKQRQILRARIAQLNTEHEILALKLSRMESDL